MDLSKYFPSFDDFNDQVTTAHFNEHDLIFQKEMALRAGFSSWEDYIKIMYYLISNSHNVEAVIKDLVSDFPKSNKFVGSLPIISNNHRNIELQEELLPITEKVKTFPEEDQDRIGVFENTLIKLFKLLMIGKRKDDPIALELISAFDKDASNQYKALHTKDNDGNSLIDSFLFPLTNAVFEKYTTPNFYFPEMKVILDQLHDLLSKELIEPNVDFAKTFEKEYKEPSLKPTLWIGDATELYYLLYQLNNKREYVNNAISLDKVAHQLFAFREPKKANAIRTGFKNALKNFEKESYLEKKMQRIIAILEELSQKS